MAAALVSDQRAACCSIVAFPMGLGIWDAEHAIRIDDVTLLLSDKFSCG